MNNTRDRVFNIADGVEKLMKASGCNTSGIESLQTLKQDMEEDFFTILVVGEFKRGKTTFVNALLGEDLLVSDVLPETATIQAVMQGKEKKAQVIFQDGTVVNGKATKEFLKEYSAKNADVANNIRYIKIAHDSELISPKVVLVDTPGVADLDEQRVKVTYDFLPKANAVLFLLDAVSPLKKSEKEFIEEQLVPNGISKIVFVINKMDIFDDEEEDVQDYLNTVRNRISEAFSDSFDRDSLQILPVSALQALRGEIENDPDLIASSGIEEVKTKLKIILFDGDIEKQKQDRYKSRLMHIIKAWELQVEKEISMYQTDVSVLQTELNNVNVLQANLDNRYDLMEKYVRNEQEMMESMLIKSLERFHADLLEELTYQVNHFLGKDFASFVERDVPHFIKKQTESWMYPHMNAINTNIDKLERKVSEALSVYFKKKISISTNAMEEIRIHPEIELQGEDTKYASLKAGGGVALAMIALTTLTPLGFLAPLITMYALPYVREGAQESAVENAKQLLIPELEKVTYPFVCELRDKIESAMNMRFNEMLNSISYSYNRFVDEYKDNMSKCIAAKQQDESRAAMNLQALQKNSSAIKQLVAGIEVI
ncbi:MAG: dynamin family protein [Lachnospiraceae bacterium]|nr:dynamin family protein [Lachnospiraceae bacterium]